MAVSLSSPLPSPSPSEIRGRYQRRPSYLETADTNTPDPEFNGTPPPPIENQDAQELAQRSPSAVRPTPDESLFLLEQHSQDSSGETAEERQIAMPQPIRIPQLQDGPVQIIGGFDRCSESKQ